MKKFSIFSQKKLRGNSTFLYFKKGIFRTLTYLQLVAYSEPEANSKHCQTYMMEPFAKIPSTLLGASS